MCLRASGEEGLIFKVLSLFKSTLKFASQSCISPDLPSKDILSVKSRKEVKTHLYKDRSFQNHLLRMLRSSSDILGITKGPKGPPGSGQQLAASSLLHCAAEHHPTACSKSHWTWREKTAVLLLPFLCTFRIHSASPTCPHIWRYTFIRDTQVPSRYVQDSQCLLWVTQVPGLFLTRCF